MSNTQCKDPSVTWYNNQDGLNPCEQYSALRKLCDTGYNVPVLTPNTPPDNCESQNKACCCNSIAFSLSMLCLQCQQGVGTGRAGDNGIDAGKGAYQMYLGGCGAGTNKTLPDIVQAAVCKSGLKLMEYQYDLFWGTGDWFLEFTRQTANLETAAGKLDPGKCPAESTTTPPPSTTLPLSTSASSASTTNSQDQAPGTIETNSGGSHNAALIGGSVGAAVAIVILVGLIALMLWRRRKEEDRMSQRPNMAPVPYGSGSGFVGSSNQAIAPTSFSGVRPYTEYSDQQSGSIVGSSVTGSAAAPVTPYPQHAQSAFPPNSYAPGGAVYHHQQPYQHTYAAVHGAEADPFVGGPPVAAAAVAHQPSTAHERKMASANGSGARVNRDPRLSITSPVFVTSTTSPLDLSADPYDSDLVRHNTRATMSRPPEYPFDELPHRESMAFAVSSHEPSEGPRTRYAPTDFDADEGSAYGGMARSARSTSPPTSDFRR